MILAEVVGGIDEAGGGVLGADLDVLALIDQAEELVDGLNRGALGNDDDLHAGGVALGEADGLEALVGDGHAGHAHVDLAGDNGRDDGVKVHVLNVELHAELVSDQAGDDGVDADDGLVLIELVGREGGVGAHGEHFGVGRDVLLEGRQLALAGDVVVNDLSDGAVVDQRGQRGVDAVEQIGVFLRDGDGVILGDVLGVQNLELDGGVSGLGGGVGGAFRRGSAVVAAAGGERSNHQHSQKQGDEFFHFEYPLFITVLGWLQFSTRKRESQGKNAFLFAIFKFLCNCTSKARQF